MQLSIYLHLVQRIKVEKVHCKGKGPSGSLSDAMWTMFGLVSNSLQK
jgi:hypothetical protein